MSTGMREAFGSRLRCKGWEQEAALRMLANTIELEASRRPPAPSNSGAAQRREGYASVARALAELKNDETLFVNNGLQESIITTHPSAPRVLIAGAAVALKAHGLPSSGRPAQVGLALHGEMAAESWIGADSEEMLLGAYAVFESAARKHFGGSLSGKLIASGGAGRMGGALSLAATLHGAAFLGIEVDAGRIKERVRSGYCDYCVNNLDEALRILKIAVRQKQAISVGLEGNCADVIPELERRGVVPDLLTDQTGARDLLHGYIPSGLSLEAAARLRSSAPGEYMDRSRDSVARHVSGMLDLQRLGAEVFEYGNGIFAIAADHCGVKRAREIPEFVSAYLDPLILEEGSPFRWVALSSEPSDIHRLDALAVEMCPEDSLTGRWIRRRQKHVKFLGLPARAGWLRPDAQAQFGMRIDELVRNGKLKAPVVLGRDDPGDARQNASTGGFGDPEGGGSLSSAMLDSANGASWASIQSDEAGNIVAQGRAIVASGAPEAGARIGQVFASAPPPEGPQ